VQLGIFRVAEQTPQLGEGVEEGRQVDRPIPVDVLGLKVLLIELRDVHNWDSLIGSRGAFMAHV
jgi:hypothetical protein